MTLSVRGVHVKNCDKAVDFDLHKGEILGFFGLIGAGRTELARILFGIDKIGEGKMTLDGVEIHNNSPKDAIDNGLALLPEDRKRIGLIPTLSLQRNLTLVKLRELGFFLLGKNTEKQITQEYMERLSIVARDQNQLVSHLSGGNQQKVVFGKWLSINPKIIIMDEPTRGIDVRAKAEIYALMKELAASGVSIILISSDLPEILRVSNRIIVMHDSHITLDEKRQYLDSQKIMDAAIG